MAAESAEATRSMNGTHEAVGELHGVSLRYENVIALDEVTIAFPAGCMVGLIGPDGVGKSSLLSLIAGARRIQEGQVRVLGGESRRRRSSRRCLPAHRLYAARIGQESLPRSQRAREYRILWAALRSGSRRTRSKNRGPLAGNRPRSFSRPAGEQALGRHAPETRALLRADP